MTTVVNMTRRLGHKETSRVYNARTFWAVGDELKTDLNDDGTLIRGRVVHYDPKRAPEPFLVKYANGELHWVDLPDGRDWNKDFVAVTKEEYS